MFSSTRILMLLALVAGLATVALPAVATTWTYSFNDIPAGDHYLTGIHNDIDFGTGLWRSYDGPWNGLTNTAYFDYTGGQSGSSRIFILPSDTVLKSIRLTSDAGGTYTISDGVNTDVSGSVDNTYGGILVTTGWTTNAATVTVTLSAKDSAGIDDITAQTSSVPEPGSILALGSGLVGLLSFGIRRRK